MLDEIIEIDIEILEMLYALLQAVTLKSL